ncbi:MAG: hypothetical protein HY608_09055 [Planctomycetes bacterium]|nr:hypothetical protein [Planctomycetota bacterium]
MSASGLFRRGRESSYGAGAAVCAVFCLLAWAGHCDSSTGGAAVPFPEFEEAQRQSLEWSRRMLENRSRSTPELRRILAHRVHVPVPVGDGTPARAPLRIPVVAPWDILGVFPETTLVVRTAGEPRVTVSGEAEGSLLFAKRTVSASCQITDDDPVWQTKDEATTDFADWFEGVLSEPFSLIGLNFSIHGGRVDEVSGKFEAGYLSAVAGMRPGDPGSPTEVFAGGGAELSTPDVLKHLASASVKADVEVALSVEGVDIEYGSPFARSSLRGRLASAVERLVLTRIGCPRCSARGELTCSRCANARTVRCDGCGDARTVTCPRCQGARTFECSRCGGAGWLACETTDRCWRCGGTGVAKCSSCSNGTVYEEMSETRWESEMRSAGFDANGDPYYEMVRVPRTHTWQEARPCGSCGGSGTAGACGNCGGTGTVVCGSCGGSGQRGCGRCTGTGRASCGGCRGAGTVRCPTCRGRPPTCPECRGRTIVCPICRGRKGFGGGGRVGGH